MNTFPGKKYNDLYKGRKILSNGTSSARLEKSVSREGEILPNEIMKLP